jgi:hypothetical protein
MYSDFIVWKAVKLWRRDRTFEWRQKKCYLPQLFFIVINVCLCFRSDVEELLSHVCDNNQNVESVTVTRAGSIYCSHWGFLCADCLNRLIFCCPKIQRLKLNYIHIDNESFYNNLSIRLPKLTWLHLSHNITLKPQHIKIIATDCCNLVQFWLSGKDNLYYYKDWEDAYRTLFQHHWRTLTHLQLDAFGLRDDGFKVLKYVCLCVCVCVCVCNVCMHRWMDGWADGCIQCGYKFRNTTYIRPA